MFVAYVSTYLVSCIEVGSGRRFGCSLVWIGSESEIRLWCWYFR